MPLSLTLWLSIDPDWVPDQTPVRYLLLGWKQKDIVEETGVLIGTVDRIIDSIEVLFALVLHVHRVI
jgi:hypothetical protein